MGSLRGTLSETTLRETARSELLCKRLVVGIGEQCARLAGGEPAQVVDLAIRDRDLAADHGHDPVTHALGAPAAVEVSHRVELRAERALEAGFLGNRADRGLFGRLVALELALGEGPVVVLRAVHERDLDPVARGRS